MGPKKFRRCLQGMIVNPNEHPQVRCKALDFLRDLTEMANNETDPDIPMINGFCPQPVTPSHRSSIPDNDSLEE